MRRLLPLFAFSLILSLSATAFAAASKPSKAARTQQQKARRNQAKARRAVKRPKAGSAAKTARPRAN